MSLNSPSLLQVLSLLAVLLPSFNKLPQLCTLPVFHKGPTAEDSLGVGRFLLLSPHRDLQQGGQLLMVHQQPHGMERGWSHPGSPVGSSRRWGCSIGPDIKSGDQAGKKPTYSTAKGKVASGLSLNGAPGRGQGVGLSWGCSGPLKLIGVI